MDYIEVKGLTKIFGKDVVAVDNANFSLQYGEFASLLGPSGCGKSTILNMVSGLIEPTEAEIFVDEKCFYSHFKGINVPAEKREMGMVFQDFALWPHLNVFENVAFGLRLRKVPSKEIKKSWCSCPASKKGFPENCLGDSSNGLPLPGPLSFLQRCYCWMNRSVPWTQNCAKR
ncbi:MAG: ATP-binding cassette domain-containing protein [Deltaproteobacteria bacterium]|nr:ATP-binding cassette domain-containing protein [Deltaproteobacteria bacterium]